MFFRYLLLFVLVGLVACSTDKTGNNSIEEKKVAKTAKQVSKQVPSFFKGAKRIKGEPQMAVLSFNGKKYSRKNDKQKVNKVLGENTVIKGWAIDKISKMPAGEVYARIGEKYIKAKYGNKSNRIAEKMKNEKLSNSGFILNIDNKYFKEKEQFVTFFIFNIDKSAYWVSKKNKIKMKK